MTTKTTSADILSRLGKKAKANQNHLSVTTGDKDPMTPLKDTTAAGKWEGNTHEDRKLDKTGAKEPIDTSVGETGEDDSTAKQDYAKEYEGIYKGKGSAATAGEIGKKLKEGLELTVNLEDMKSLLEASEADEKFITDSLSIFEATMLNTLNNKIDSIIESAVGIVENILEEEVEALEEQVEEYLNVAVMEWAEDNRLAIEESTRVNIAESFMSDLTNLMESYNIVLPEESVDLYEHSLEVGNQLIEENEELAEQLAESREELQTLNKTIYVESFISDSNLTMIEGERLRKVSSELEFINESDFNKKLNTISESYIKRNTKTIREGQSVITQPLQEGDADSFTTLDEDEAINNVDPMVQLLANKFTL